MTKSCCSPTRTIVEAPSAHPVALPTQSAAPDDTMLQLAGGPFLMGTTYPQGFPADGEGPVRTVTLDPFRLDPVPVTNAEFTRFIRSTGYVTEAQRFGWSFVFWSHIPQHRFRALVADTVAATPWWCQVPGARWDRPEGPGSNLRTRQDHPVVHVTWNDAAAYAHWAGKCLPTEAQWEFAARGGLVQKLYPWGDDLLPEGRHQCNIWQGEFPRRDTRDDGFAGSNPVRAFPPNGQGMYSAVGNVWEWCSDWFTTAPEPRSGHNPRGPEKGATRVMKGGSFLCHASYCNRYRVAARTANTPESSASNIGFRCAAP